MINRRRKRLTGAPLPAPVSVDADETTVEIVYTDDDDITLSAVDDAEFDSRNWAFITPEEQAVLRQQTVLLAGTGLASQIAALACRTGFTRFIVADGDSVELSNLNRQAFRHADIGRNKAEATADLLRAIRQSVEVETLPRFLDAGSIREPLTRASVAVSSLNWDSPDLFEFNRVARELGVPVLMPINLGWGGAVMVLTAHSPSLEEFIGFDSERHARQDVVKLVIERIFTVAPGGIPPYLRRVFATFMSEGEQWRYDPQLGVAAAMTSALAVRAMVALALGEPVAIVPNVLYVDARVASDPGLTSAR